MFYIFYVLDGNTIFMYCIFFICNRVNKYVCVCVCVCVCFASALKEFVVKDLINML